jgi:hypothetical protein
LAINPKRIFLSSTLIVSSYFSGSSPTLIFNCDCAVFLTQSEDNDVTEVDIVIEDVVPEEESVGEDEEHHEEDEEGEAEAESVEEDETTESKQEEGTTGKRESDLTILSQSDN